jgi:hypothetical protein
MKPFLVVILLAIAGWIYLEYDERRFLQEHVLKVGELPKEMKVLDRETWAWTDHREEYLLSFDPNDSDVLLSGRVFGMREVSRSTYEMSAGLRKHEAFPLVSCYYSGDWQSQNGAVEVCFDSSKSKAFVSYTAD